MPDMRKVLLAMAGLAAMGIAAAACDVSEAGAEPRERPPGAVGAPRQKAPWKVPDKTPEPSRGEIHGT